MKETYNSQVYCILMAGPNPNPPIDDGEDVEIEVRPYKIEDYQVSESKNENKKRTAWSVCPTRQAVFDLAKESRLEPWANAYWRTINGAKASGQEKEGT